MSENFKDRVRCGRQSKQRTKARRSSRINIQKNHSIARLIDWKAIMM